MGTNYTLYDLKNKRQFDLGRYSIGGYFQWKYGDPITDTDYSGLESMRADGEDKFHNGLYEHYFWRRDIEYTPEDEDYLKKLSHLIWQFCQEADWQVQVLDDTACWHPEREDWPMTHSCDRRETNPKIITPFSPYVGDRLSSIKETTEYLAEKGIDAHKLAVLAGEAISTEKFNMTTGDPVCSIHGMLPCRCADPTARLSKEELLKVSTLTDAQAQQALIDAVNTRTLVPINDDWVDKNVELIYKAQKAADISDDDIRQKRWFLVRNEDDLPEFIPNYELELFLNGHWTWDLPKDDKLYFYIPNFRGDTEKQDVTKYGMDKEVQEQFLKACSGSLSVLPPNFRVEVKDEMPIIKRQKYTYAFPYTLEQIKKFEFNKDGIWWSAPVPCILEQLFKEEADEA